jgi:hypothetical protein
VWLASHPRTETFRLRAQGVARRRGKKVAIVALTRRLARTLFAMWRDEADLPSIPGRAAELFIVLNERRDTLGRVP